LLNATITVVSKQASLEILALLTLTVSIKQVLAITSLQFVLVLE